MGEKEPREPITLERHAWGAFGIFMAVESVRILANGWEPANSREALEHLILGLAIPAWFIWGEGIEPSLKATLGFKVEERSRSSF